MPRALISVSDKTGLEEFARGLHTLGWEILSTGGTAKTLRGFGLDVIDVSEITQHPEMMDGRVKTLHPAVHAGLLARRHRGDDRAAMHQLGYEMIDLVAVNLYKFHEAVAAGADLDAAMEKVDIGGPSMLRSAAKNHASVLTIVDPGDYPRVLDALTSGTDDLRLRRELAHKVFDTTARYDRAIADYFLAKLSEEEAGHSGRPIALDLHFRKVQDLRYGENPEQQAAFYAEADAPRDSLAHMRQYQGKELSFNNILDMDAAVMTISAWVGQPRVACAIIKHTTPCGVAVAATAEEAYARAVAADPVSAFGGIVALNSTVTAPLAEAICTSFYEIIIAPAFEYAALQTFQKKKNLRIIELPITPPAGLDYKRVYGGLLVQDRLRMEFPEDGWKVVTERPPTLQELEDMRFAYRVCAAVKSNAIVMARNGQTLGIGAGQMSRVDSSRIAVMKAADQNANLTGAALASDAFFPFRDGVDAAAAAGVRAVIQPGGSVRDDEVIAAANEHGIAMIFTGRRVFRH